MGSKFKVAGLLALGAVAGALTTMQLQATARNSLASLPLEDIQRLTDVFQRIKDDYVVPVDEKKLISDDDIVGLNIPNGIPLVYELDDDLKPLRHYYLGDAEAAEKAVAAVAAQGKG